MSNSMEIKSNILDMKLVPMDVLTQASLTLAKISNSSSSNGKVTIKISNIDFLSV